MTYSTGGQGYPLPQQHGGYTPPPNAPAQPAGPSKLPTYLLGAVVVLGLVGYLLSFGPVYGDSDYSQIRSASFTVNFAVAALVFAGLLAAVGLLPKQDRSYTGLLGVIAVTGFLLAILELINNADAAGWALIVIVIVGGLQALAAIGALLLDAGVVAAPTPRLQQEHYPQYGGGGYGQPQNAGHQLGGPPAPQQPPAPPQQPPQQPGGQHAAYSQYGGGYPPPAPTAGFSSGAHHAGPPTPPTGFPVFSQPPSTSATVVTRAGGGAHEADATKQLTRDPGITQSFSTRDAGTSPAPSLSKPQEQDTTPQEPPQQTPTQQTPTQQTPPPQTPPS